MKWLNSLSRRQLLWLALVSVVALAVGGRIVGAAVGRGIWELAARDTARRVDRLASELASAVTELGSKEPSSGGDYDTTS